MSAKIYSNRYNHIYSTNLVQMVKDFNSVSVENSITEYTLEIKTKCGVEYVYIKDGDKLIYTDDWFVVIQPFGDFIWVSALYVKPECRRTGLGTFIIKHLVKAYEKVFLGCSEQRNESIDFYKSLNAKENISCLKGVKTFVFESC